MCSEICNLLPGHKHIKFVKGGKCMHGTIGPRKFCASQKIFQVHINKIFQCENTLCETQFEILQH